MFAVQRLRRAEVHGNAVLHHSVLLQYLVEHLQRAPPIDHEILRDDFKPVDHRLLIKDVLVMRNAQPDADAVIREAVEAICGH